MIFSIIIDYNDGLREMSLAIYGSSGAPELHTMTTTKELRVMYLDGHSATLTSTGTLDSQMAILGGHVPKDPSEDLVYNENQRAVELCQLADKLGIDGVVRMNAGFEILVCDYSKSNMRNLFTTNVTVPGNKAREHDASLPRDPHRQPPLGYGNDFSEQNGWEWVRSSTWHYGNGDTGGIPENRIRLDLCGFTTWYDPSLRSLINSHHGGVRVNDTYQNGWGLRRGHRLLGASKEDIGIFRDWISEATSRRKNSKCSNTDWQALIETITSKYNSRAQEILFHLNKNSSDDQAAHMIVESVYTLSHAILFPYHEYPIVAGVTKSEAKAKTVALCSEAYTGHIDLESLSDFEMLIEQSAYIINSRLCQWAWDIFEWSDSRMHGRLEKSGRATAPNSFENMKNVRHEIVQRKDETRFLLKWIGWDTWQKCETECAPNVSCSIPHSSPAPSMHDPYECFPQELCYIPMWPVIYAPGQPQGGIYAGADLTEEETVEFWKPKCISRQDFDCGGGRGREPQHQFPDVPYEKCKALQKETKM